MKSKETNQSAEPVAVIEVGMIDTRLINGDPNQPRKDFNDESLAELTRDIKQHGIIQPITVRPDPKTKVLSPKELKDKKCFKIVCGERRFRAACNAGLSEIPCIVRDLSDNEAFELQISENLQRNNINPMEESNAFQQLIDRGIDTAEQIADKFGTSVKYVYDRLILQNVITDVQNAIKEGKLTISHGKQFAKIPHFEQQKLWDQVCDDDTLTVAELKAEIRDTFKLKLEDAPFDIKDAKLVKKAGSCMKCQKRSGCRLVLFEEAEPGDFCFDKECWNTKVQASIDNIIEEYKAKGKEVELLSCNYSPADKLLVRSHDWKDRETTAITDRVGIVVEANTWSEHKIGDVVYLDGALEPEEEEESSVTTSSKSNKSLIPTYNWSNDLCDQTVTALVNQYRNYKKFPEVDLKEFLIKEIRHVVGMFGWVEDEELINKYLGLNIDDYEDADGDYDVDLFVKSFTEKMDLKELQKALKFFQLLEEVTDDIPYNPSKEEFNNVNSLLAPAGVDMHQFLTLIEEKAGKKLIDFDSVTE